MAGVMIAAGSAAAAAWLLVPAGRVRRRGARRLRMPPWAVCAVLVGGVVVGVTGTLGGAAGTVATALGVVGAGVGAVVQSSRREAARERLADEVARACSALAQELSVGRVPTTALGAAAEDFPVLAPAAAAIGVGGDVTAPWRAAAETPGAEGLGRLARAWSMAERTGAPLADTLEGVADRLRADREVAAVVAAELAAARVTGRLLTALPLAGLAIGYGIGGDPVGFLVGHLVGRACLVLGAALAVTGLWWTERMGR